jgi:predicted glycoside hydrolase/deacetylase ChbG (UPF0249 family)
MVGASVALPSSVPDRRTTAERLGHPASSRLLVIHADDFGMSHSVNRATALAFEKEWITSASIMVTCPWFPEVVTFAKRHPDACLGLHLTLNSEWTGFRWGPVASRHSVSSLLDADGYLPLLETEVVEKARIEEVGIELSAQIEKALAAGIALTHFDPHMSTLLRSRDLFATYLALSKRFRMPARVGAMPGSVELAAACTLVDAVCEVTPEVPAKEWFDGYTRVLAALAPGSYQLTVHLGFDDDEMRGATHQHPNWGAAWRQRDLDLVGSSAFRDFLSDQGFILVSWRDLGRALHGD